MSTKGTRSTDTKIGKNRSLWVYKSNHNKGVNEGYKEYRYQIGKTRAFVSVQIKSLIFSRFHRCLAPTPWTPSDFFFYAYLPASRTENNNNVNLSCNVRHFGNELGRYKSSTYRNIKLQSWQGSTSSNFLGMNMSDTKWAVWKIVASYGERRVIIAYSHDSSMWVSQEGRMGAAGQRATRGTDIHAATRKNHLSSI